MRPTIGVVIATPGRKSLLRTLASIKHQGLITGDDVLVVGDGHNAPTESIVTLMGPPFRYVATKKTRDWGHSQQNYGLGEVRGDWLLLQDDDDIFLPRAFDEARTIISGLEYPRPIMGRVKTPYLGILWSSPGSEPLDGHCLVIPNDKKKLGYFGLDYAGDQVWLSSNLKAYDACTWADRVWSLTRPTWSLWPELVQCADDRWGWLFMRDDDGTPTDTPVALLYMSSRENVWDARVDALGDPSTEEMKEVFEFAAWAGQGSDVWLRCKKKWLSTLLETRYAPHKEQGQEVECVSSWPPGGEAK